MPAVNLRYPIFCCALLLAACSNETFSSEAVSAAADAEPAAALPAVEPGLLIDPGFEIAGKDVPLRHWGLYQHAGDTSYRLEVSKGSARIERTGSEPWGVLSQTLPADALAGKTLEWSVELSGELDDRYGPPFEATGLLVSVTGFGPADLPMMGSRHLLTLASEPGLPTGRLTAERHLLRFQIPEGRELQLRVGVQLTRGGVLELRAPSLTVVEPSEAP
jgi:hypothetical protein